MYMLVFFLGKHVYACWAVRLKNQSVCAMVTRGWTISKMELISFGPYTDLKAHQWELNWAAFVSYVTLIPLKGRNKNDATIKEVNDYGAFKIWIFFLISKSPT